MFCPRCGQEQISAETRFCSRCGLPLIVVTEIITHGGFLPQLDELYKQRKWLTRKNGLVFSLLWFIFFVPFLVPFFAGALDAEIPAMLAALTGVFGSFAIFIISLAFLKPAPKGNYLTAAEMQNQSPKNLSGARQTALPPHTGRPADSYIPPAGAWNAPPTGEFADPGSVTEGTTKLLDKEE